MKRQNLIPIYFELRKELEQIPPRGRSQDGLTRTKLFERFAREYGVRPNTYRLFARTHFGTGRADAGKLRKAEGYDSIVRALFRLKCEMSDFEGGRWISTERVVQEAERRELIGPGQWSPRNLNLWFGKLHLTVERGYTSFQAEYANQVHQMDVSGSAYLQVARAEGEDFVLYRRSPRSRLAKTQKAEGLRLWLVGIKDDYSRVAAFQYVVARGESAAMVRATLDKLWRGVSAEHVLRGIPDILYCDNGPFARAEETIPYLSEKTGLGVELRVHEPYRARSTGKMEKLWGDVKRDFESPFLATERAEWRLAEVNRMATGWCIENAQRAHPFVQGTRAEVFTAGLQGEPRIPHAESLRTAARTLLRTVDGNAVISIDSERYQVPASLQRQQVWVYQNSAGEVVVESLFTGERCQAEKWAGPHGYGEFHGYAETERERVAKARERGEWGQGVHPQDRTRNEERGTIWAQIPHDAQAQSGHAGEQPLAAKDGPFGAAPRFKDAIEAKTWIARALNLGLLTVKQNYPQLWEELNELLERTLDKQEVGQWTDVASERLRGGVAAIGGGQ